MTSPAATANFITQAIMYVGFDCLLWPFGKTSGYGRIGKGYVHKLVCEAVHGPNPTGYQVAHNCGVRACINPRHLRWDTPKNNTFDQIAHFGGQHPNAKLTVDQVQSILSQPHRSGVTLATEYKVTPTAICDIRHKRNWKWL